jgi:addiction module HigA family antidote
MIIDKLKEIHPGTVLLNEFMKPMGLTNACVSKGILVETRRIIELVAGERSMTADTALRLSKFFGNSAEFWMWLQSKFELAEKSYEMSRELKKIKTTTVTLTLSDYIKEKLEDPEFRELYKEEEKFNNKEEARSRLQSVTD